MLGALLLNLDGGIPPVVEATSAGGFDWSDVFHANVGRLLRKAAQRRQQTDEDLKRRIAAEIHGEEEQVEQLQAAYEQVKGDPYLALRLERAAERLAALEIEAARARTAQLESILLLAREVAAEIDDEEMLIRLLYPPPGPRA